MLTAIDVEQHFDGPAGGGGRPGKRSDRFGVIGDRGEASPGKPLHQLHETADVRSNGLVGQQYVRRAATGRHLGLRDGGALEPGDATRQLQADQFRHLMRFHVGTQPLDASGQGDHAPEVFLDAIGINQQRGGRNLGGVADGEPDRGIRGHGSGCGVERGA